MLPDRGAGYCLSLDLVVRGAEKFVNLPPKYKNGHDGPRCGAGSGRLSPHQGFEISLATGVPPQEEDAHRRRGEVNFLRVRHQGEVETGAVVVAENTDNFPRRSASVSIDGVLSEEGGFWGVHSRERCPRGQCDRTWIASPV